MMSLHGSARRSSRRILRHGGAERGAVLIVVLWTLLWLAGMALFFGHAMMLEVRAAENTVAGLEAEQAIEGARRYVVWMLTQLDEPGRLPEITEYETEDAWVGDAGFWLIGRGEEEQIEGRPAFGLVAESSKLNLNTATREMLELLPNMTAELAAAIIDWRDEDDETSPDGAESQTYLLRTPAYHAKNAPFETLGELRLLNGADLVLLAGEDRNRNGWLDPNEDDGADTPPDDNRNGVLDPGLFEYLTVYSREPNRRADGSERIRLTGDVDGLRQLLEDTFGEERAQNIPAVPNPGSVLEYFLRSGLTSGEFVLIEDAVTVSDGEFVEGLINVNTASAAVLACVPGIGETYAGALTAYRRGLADRLMTVTWVADVLPEESAIQAGPSLTVRAYQFTADVAAVGRGGRGFRRAQFVIDTSAGTPVIRYRQDLSGLGWPLGAEIRDWLAILSAEGANG